LSRTYKRTSASNHGERQEHGQVHCSHKCLCYQRFYSLQLFLFGDEVAKGEKITANIVIGTPGTVLELIRRKQIDVSRIKIFVLDEADNMVDTQGLGDQSIRIKTFDFYIICV
jgi:DEAD/DEAH box helicase